MKIVGYLRPERADELKAIAARLDRTISWCVAQAVDAWLVRAGVVQPPDSTP